MWKKLLRAGVLLSTLCAVAFGGNNVWTSGGPFGGAFLSFTFHPQVVPLVFAGSFDGVYRSMNGGQSWERMDLSEGNDFPAVIRIHPSDPGTTLATTEAYLFRSTNLGNTWQELSRLPAEFSDLEFHSANPSILYGVTYRKGVFKSTDGGRTWTSRNTGLQINPLTSCCDTPQLEVSRKDGNVVFVLLGNRKIYRSTNAGDSWTQASQGLQFQDEARALVIDPLDPLRLYAGGWDGLFRTTNGGSSWAAVSCDCDAPGVALDPLHPQVIYTAGGLGAHKSTNGGDTWIQLGRSGPIIDAGLVGVGVHPRQGNLVLLGGDGAGIFRSVNSGQTWKLVNRRVDALPIRHLASANASRIFAQGDFQVYVSRNGGNSWNLWPLGHNFDTRDVDVHPRSAELVAVAGDFEGGSVALSTNGGTSFVIRGPAGATGSSAVTFDPEDPAVLYLAPRMGSQNLGIARSSNLGAGWSFVNTGLADRAVTVLQVDPRNSSIVYAGTTSGKVFRSDNKGGNWKNSSSGLRGRVTALAIVPDNSNVIFAATLRGIFRSANGGRNWKIRPNGLPSGFEFAFVSVHPVTTQLVFAGGEDGLFISADGGDNWGPFATNGLGRILAGDLLVPAGRPDLFLLGDDRGVFSYRRTVVPGGPVIDQVAPAFGKPGDAIQVSGRNFGTSQGNSRVFFGTAQAGSTQSWSDSRIVVRVPSGVRTAPLSLIVGSRRSNAHEFVVTASDGAIQPSGGTSAGGTSASITVPPSKRSFSFVLFGETLARDIRFVPPSTITCTTPPGSGTVRVSVVSTTGVTDVGNYTYQ